MDYVRLFFCILLGDFIAHFIIRAIENRRR